MTVVRADGWFTQPLKVETIDINPGMSFDLLVTMDQRPKNYWLTVQGQYDNIGLPVPGLGVLKYEGTKMFNDPQPYDTPWPQGPSIYDLGYGPSQQLKFKNLYNIKTLTSRKVRLDL